MIKNIDTYMAIGSSHHVCEDYVYSSFGKNPYIILADGCSSSKNADIGARVLVHAARVVFEKFLDGAEVNNSAGVIGDLIITHAEEIINKMGLDKSALDATLIMAYKQDDKIKIYVYGDGNVILKKKDGTLKIFNYQFDNNMPNYLSYRNDINKANKYSKIMNDAKNNGNTLKITYFDCNALTEEDNVYAMEVMDHFSFIPSFSVPINEYEMIAITSDGIESFVDSHNGSKKDLTEIATELTAFKGTVGEFVKRRCKRAMKNYTKGKINHYDDVSMGVMLLGED